MSKYRKKPVVIEAMQYRYGDPAVRAFLGASAGHESKARHPSAKGELEIVTLEDGHDQRAKHVATEGDFIIKGVQGEFYPCKPDIFEATYEAAE
ncbi:hypothetical protein [Aminobacter ciceronei]|uniref:Phage protein n=1 Tax=Aminobacter ciceronei TaxID=150723 RepID=A0ABR6C6F4_9HYPH|nr:hypothetical protein [Aminobacter ciceronei]MBA8906789.1 hypothetical protein [Aminobacter ciceronei]MBA9020568.1 hypothetical protein [Aminobacter ciceronei]